MTTQIGSHRRRFLCGLCAVCAAEYLGACSAIPVGETERIGAAPSAAKATPLPAGPFRFLRAAGGRVWFDDGLPAILRGCGFGNEVYSSNALPLTHHDERDYARLHAMGMNLVRFYLHYLTFESDARPYLYRDQGWDWIDRNIEWARRHGVYLILNLHAPPGGYQSTGKGDALWSRRDNQLRLAALWRAIAGRYADEPVIAGYDLVNEPVVTHDRSQWQRLAQEIADAIRTVDRRHPVIVERVNAVAGRWDNDREMNFVTINDPNVIYTFHFYEPFTYTHQYASWTDLKNREGGPYPKGAGRDRAFLEARLGAYLDWGKRHGAALFLGEFGAIRACFEGNRGGLRWVADMVDLIDSAGLPWTYHAWHEDNFGLYFGYGSLPDSARANRALIDLLSRKLS